MQKQFRIPAAFLLICCLVALLGGTMGYCANPDAKETCAHAHHDKNGICAKCGEPCLHTYVNSKCSVCGKALKFEEKLLDRSWFEECPEKGTVESVYYATKNYSAEGTPEIRKKMNVYLPFGYDPSEKYDVLVLLPGYASNEDSLLVDPLTFGEEESESAMLSDLLDNIIFRKISRPVIAVNISWSANIGGTGLDWIWKNDIRQVAAEMRNDIIPYLTENYSTYAAPGSSRYDEEVRQHFGMFGFSYGAEMTYSALIPNCYDLFGWYATLSDPSIEWFTREAGFTPEFDAEVAGKVIAESDLPVNYFYSGSGGTPLEISIESSRDKYNLVRDHSEGKINKKNSSWVCIEDCGHDSGMVLTSIFNVLQEFNNITFSS